MTQRQKWKKAAIYAVIFLLIPAAIAIGILLFQGKKYNIVSILIAFLACVPFFLSFERRAPNGREIIVIAVMSAVSIAGRAVFAWIPGFKPVTAVTILAAMSLGPEAGFLTGAVSAIVSNMFFGQGPWTPFQMFAWGIIGFFAGVLARTGAMKNKWFLAGYGAVSGILFSVLMDLWTAIAVAEGGSFGAKYLVALTAALPWMAVYAVSNVIFLLVLQQPVGQTLERIRVKYGLGVQKKERPKSEGTPGPGGGKGV